MPVPVARLPSLDLIRSFVAVGRRMSITLAAADLCVTQSAVSRQVHALEEALGVRLLVRGHRSIAFTAEGERLFQVASEAVGQIQDVVTSLAAARDRRPVSLSAPIGFVGLWLLPRMGDFQAKHPDIALSISADVRIVDLRTDGIDLAIRYCPPSAAPQGAVRLFGETLAVVASPALRDKALKRAEDVSAYFLLEFDDARRNHLRWDDWLAATGWQGVKPKGVLRFNQYDQVIYAALAGQGLALGRLEILGKMLADRRLVAVSKPRRLGAHEYASWLIQADARPRKDVAAVVRWIREQAAGQTQEANARPLQRATA